MSQDLPELIANVANARREAREMDEAAQRARAASNAADDRLEAAQIALRAELTRRMDAIDPPPDDDASPS